MKEWLKKFLIGLAVILIGLVGVYRFWMYPRYTVPILMYHRVGNVDSLLFVTQKNFERQMKYLRDHHYHVIPLDKFIAEKRAGDQFPHNTVVITFDDGHESCYSKAFPILKKYHMPATMFIITQWVGGNGFLTWQQVREMSDAGVIIGSHTQHHVYLPGVDLDKIKAEVAGSKKDIETHLGKPAKYFCYPSGGFTEAAKEIVAQAGYLAALTTNRGYDRYNHHLYQLMRIKVSNKDAVKPFHFWGKLSGYYNLFRTLKRGY